MKKLMLTAAAMLLAVSAFAKNDALSLVPADAVTVGVVKISEMRSSPLSGALFQQTDKITTDGDAAKFLTDAGLQPTKDIDVIMVATSPKSGNLSKEAEILVAAEGRFNVDRLTAALVSRGAKKTANYFVLPTPENDSDHISPAIAFPSSGLVVMGTESAVKEALTSYARGGTNFASTSGLGRDLSRIDPHATAWAIVDVPRAARLTGGPHITSKNQSAQALNSALKNVSTVAMWATDSGDSLKLGAIGLSSDTETLGLLEDTLRGALSAMRLAVQDKQPDLVSIIRRFSVSRSNDSISISGSVPAETFREYARKQSK
jgi:hypothetical protein